MRVEPMRMVSPDGNAAPDDLGSASHPELNQTHASSVAPNVHHAAAPNQFVTLPPKWRFSFCSLIGLSWE